MADAFASPPPRPRTAPAVCAAGGAPSADDEGVNVRVCIRARPMNATELKGKGTCGRGVPDEF
jgi:hypothetical protein